MSGRRVCLLALVCACALLGCSLTATPTSAVPGGAEIPDGFDHEPVIMTKEKLAGLKAAKVAGGDVHAPAPAVLESVPLSPTAPAEGRFAPRHSFNGPWPEKKLIPYWDVGAGADVLDKSLRLTPAKQSRTGYAWNNQMVEMTDWEVTIEFSATGRKDLGGDGFAIWFVERPEILGTVYGSTDYWNGLGLFFDTFNNDGIGKSPLISAVFNDGTQKYDAGSDGATQALESCSFDFRNQPVPSVAKLRFQAHTLSLDIATKRDAAGQPIFAPCFHLDGIELGVDKYFGVTAHTGDVADAHDIFRFDVIDLSPAVVDLDAVRAKYTEEMHHQHSEHEHGHTQTADEFQHSVLTLLSQIQGEVNLLETGQIEIQDAISVMREATLHVNEDGEATPKHPTAELDPASLARLTLVSDAQAKLLAEVMSLKAQVTAMPRAAATATTGTPTPATGDITLSQASIIAIVNSLKGSLPSGGAVGAVDPSLKADLTRVVQAQQSQQTKLDDLNAAIQRVHVQLTNLASHASSSRTGGVPLSSFDGGISYESWIVGGCSIFSAVCTLALAIHTYQQSRAKDRWKLT